MGLSEEIHPPKHYSNSKGLVSKNSLKQNRSETKIFEEGEIDLKTIPLSTTPFLEGYQIVEYLGVISEHLVISEDEILMRRDDLGNEQSQSQSQSQNNDLDSDDEAILSKYYPTLVSGSKLADKQTDGNQTQRECHCWYQLSTHPVFLS
jgi:hypothetical protein